MKSHVYYVCRKSIFILLRIVLITSFTVCCIALRYVALYNIIFIIYFYVIIKLTFIIVSLSRKLRYRQLRNVKLQFFETGHVMFS